MGAVPRVSLLLVLALPSLTAGQPADEGIHVDAVVEQMQRLAASVRDRQRAVAREAAVLRVLAEGGDGIASLSPSPLRVAREKLAEARDMALAETPLGDPVPQALENLNDLLEHPGIVPAEQTRNRYFALLRPLEEDLLQKITGLESLSKNLMQLASIASSAEMTARLAAANALHTSIEVHQLALH